MGDSKTTGWLQGHAIVPLYEHLATFVPLEILELQRQGGPTGEHFEEIQRRRQAMRDDPTGDESLLFFVRKGLSAKSIGFLVECLAVMAFVPGGVKFGPLHFMSREQQSEWNKIKQEENIMDLKEEKRAQIERSFTYHPPKDDQVERYQQIREKAKELALLIVNLTPVSREQSLAITELEMATMLANKAIACNE